MNGMPTEVQLMKVEHTPGEYSIWIGPVMKDGTAPVISVEYGDVIPWSVVAQWMKTNGSWLKDHGFVQ
jgi:hypothetical protein